MACDTCYMGEHSKPWNPELNSKQRWFKWMFIHVLCTMFLYQFTLENQTVMNFMFRPFVPYFMFLCPSNAHIFSFAKFHLQNQNIRIFGGFLAVSHGTPKSPLVSISFKTKWWSLLGWFGASYTTPFGRWFIVIICYTPYVTHKKTERQPLGVQFSHDLRWYFEMFYWCFTALPKALWQLCLWFMPVSLKYPTLVKNLGKTQKNNKKTRKTKTTIFLDSLEGGGCQPRLSEKR